MLKKVGQILGMAILVCGFSFGTGAQQLDGNEGLETGGKIPGAQTLPEVEAQAMSSGHNVSYLDHIIPGATGGRLNVAVDNADNLIYAGMYATLFVIDGTSEGNLYQRGFVDLAAYVSSVSLDEGRDLVLAGTNGDQLVVVDVSDPSSPGVVASLDLSNELRSIITYGNYGYGVTTGGNLLSFDLATPAAPQLVDTDSITYAGVDLATIGTYLIALTNTDLQVFDLSNPAAPAPVSFLNGGGDALDVSGDYGFIVTGSTLDVVNFADPNNPAYLTSFGLGFTANDCSVSGSRLHVVGFSNGLEIVDIGTPGSPASLGSTSLSGNGYAVGADGSRSFVLTSNGLDGIDASTPSSPSVADTFANQTDTIHVMRNQDWAFFAHGGHFSALNVANPLSPYEVWTYDPSGYCHSAYANSINDVILSVGTRGVDYFGFDGSSMNLLSNYNTPGNARRVAQMGNDLIVADQNPDMLVLDASDPVTFGLSLTATLTMPGDIDDVVASSPYVFAVGPSGLYVVKNPATSWSIPFSQNLPGTERAVYLDGSLLYVAAGSGGLHILDVSNPESPLYLSTWNTGAIEPWEVSVAFGLAYVTDIFGALWVVNVTDPYNPEEVAYFDPVSGTDKAVPDGNKVWLAASGAGAYLLKFGYTGVCGDDHEPNDTMAAAEAITPGSFYSAKICHINDKDWFSVDLSGAGDLQVDMHPPVGLDYDLFLYDGSGALLAYSILSGDTTESLTYTAGGAGTYYIYIQGHGGNQFSDMVSYTLIPTFTPDGGGSCSLTPDEYLYIPNVTLDGNGKPVLHIQDPNQAGAVTGYNIYRSTAPTGPWSLIGSDVTDMDGGTANIQYVDLNGDVGGPYYYQAAAYNNVCGAEGPY